MKKVMFLIIVGALLTMLATPAAALDFGIRVAFWIPGLTSNMTVDKGNVAGTTLDFKDDLDVGRIALVPWIDVWGGIGDHTVTLGLVKANFSGDQELGNAIFNGSDYTGHKTEFTMTFSVLEVTYGYKLIDADSFLAGFDLTLLGNIKYIDLDSQLESGSLDNTVNAGGFIPSLGAQVHVQIMMDILEARAVLLSKPIGNTTVTDIILEFSLTPFPFLDLSLGWRTLNFSIDRDDMEINHRMSGFWLGASISF